MKHLTITYGDLSIFDGDVEEFTWTDSTAGVAVSAKTARPTGGGLLDLLAGAARSRAAKQSTTDSEDADD